MKILRTELVGIEENDNKLKITFKTTSNEPVVFNVNNETFGITENVDIYEITFDVFPVIILNYTMKNAFTESKGIMTDRYIINIDTIGGFNDFDEFKQFVLRYPTYIRFVELIYHIFNMNPWLLFLLNISRFSYEHNITINENEIEITVEKVHVSNFFNKFTINNKTTLRLLNKNGYVLVKMANTPIIDFGNTIMYNEVIRILKERPEAMLNILIMLIITLLN